MTEQSSFPQKERQPALQPPGAPLAPPPSLLLYLGLISTSIILIAIAFSIGGADWSGLLINLASGFIGTVIILIFVDQRLRANEIQAIQDYTTTLSVRLESIFSSEIRATLAYAKVVNRQLYKIRPEPYLVRPSLEALFDINTKGFILFGPAGFGKSTLIQSIAAKQAEKVLRFPKNECIPILIETSHWIEGSLSDELWKELQKYFRVPHKTFKKWLADGRVLAIIDGINEHWKPQAAIKDIEVFQHQYPKSPLILSSRKVPLEEYLNALDGLNLPKIEMPPLTEDEIIKILSQFKVNAS